MKKQFELNGVNVELSKEQLQEMLKDFDKPVWSIEKDENEQIVLLKNKEQIRWLWDTDQNYQYNISTLVIKIAEEMGYLASEEQIKDDNHDVYNITFNIYDKRIKVNFNFNQVNGKIIDTQEHTEEIVELIKSSEDLLKYIWMENE